MARRSASVLLLLLCLGLAASSGGGQKQHHRGSKPGRAASVPQLLPAQGAANRHARGRCRGTKLRWCGPFHHQKPQPARLAPAFSKRCPGDCSGVGVCNALSGLCDCPAGERAAGSALQRAAAAACSTDMMLMAFGVRCVCRLHGPGLQRAAEAAMHRRRQQLQWAGHAADGAFGCHGMQAAVASCCDACACLTCTPKRTT